MTNKTETRIGLRDVIAGDTHICDLDEEISRVFIYGYSLEELIEQHTFEETAYLTLFGELPAGRLQIPCARARPAAGRLGFDGRHAEERPSDGPPAQRDVQLRQRR